MVLALDHVEKLYPGDVAALRSVTVDIPSGDRVAVVGPSGSGKTTMLTVLGTLERPTNGQVRIAGRDVAKASDRELAGLRAHQIGFVFQTFHLQDTLTAVDNVATGCSTRGSGAGSGGSRHKPRSSASASAIASPTGPLSCRAASASGSRSRGRSPSGRRSSSPTSRPGTSTRSRARRSWPSCTSSRQTVPRWC